MFRHSVEKGCAPFDGNSHQQSSLSNTPRMHMRRWATERSPKSRYQTSHREQVYATPVLLNTMYISQFSVHAHLCIGVRPPIASIILSIMFAVGRGLDCKNSTLLPSAYAAAPPLQPSLPLSMIQSRNPLSGRPDRETLKQCRMPRVNEYHCLDSPIVHPTGYEVL